MTARTMFEKIWRAHEVVPETAETPAVIYVDLHLTHEVTSPQAFAQLPRAGWPCGGRTARSRRSITRCRPTPARSSAACRSGSSRAARQIGELERNAREYGFELLGLRDARRGIVHVIGPELGLTQPGMTIVCGDSHTSTHGAFGTLAFGIGTTEVAHVFATQCLLQRKPKTLAITVEGALGAGVGAKDLVLAIIGRIGVAGGARQAIEYRGGDDPRAVDGRAHDGLQHVDRGGRARRDDRAGRDDVRLPARAAARAGGRGLRARGRALARRRGRCGRGLRSRDRGSTRRRSSR